MTAVGVTVNGADHDLEPGTTVQDMLTQLGLPEGHRRGGGRNRAAALAVGRGRGPRLDHRGADGGAGWLIS